MVAPAKQRKQVFLSHSEADNAIAWDLVEALRAGGFDVFSTQAVFAGANVPLLIGKALQSSDAMVVIVSPDAFKSSYVQHEVEYALGSLRYKDRLIPVIVRDTEQMPWIFNRLSAIDVKKNPRRAGQRVIQRLRSAMAVEDR